MNEYVRDKFVVRAKIIRYVRQFLDQMGFLEVGITMIDKVGCHISAIHWLVSRNAYIFQ